jgi:hypothetical protein
MVKNDPIFEYIFNVPSPEPEKFSGPIGVGVIDPNHEKVEVEFKSFQLLKKD